MKGTVDVVHDVSDSLLDDMDEGDPPSKIAFDELSLLLGKEEKDKLNNKKFKARQGSLTLPDINTLFNQTEEKDEFGNIKQKCYSRQVSCTLWPNIGIFSGAGYVV